MNSQGTGNEYHRFRRWLNKKQDQLGNATPISNPQVVRVKVNQTKSAIADSPPASTASNPIAPETKGNDITALVDPSKSISGPVEPDDRTTQAVAKDETEVTKVELIAQDKGSSTDKAPLPERVPRLQQAINRLNTSVEGLYKIKGALDKELNNIEIDPDWWEKPVNDVLTLDVETMDSQIDEVSELADRLLSERRESQEGMFPGTMSFLKTVGHTVSPATKVILTTVSQVSSSVHFAKCNVNL